MKLKYIIPTGHSNSNKIIVGILKLFVTQSPNGFFKCIFKSDNFLIVY